MTYSPFEISNLKSQIVRPRGVSLIEMLVAISLGVTVLGLAVGLIEGLFTLDSGVRENVRDRMTSARLAEQFRDDIHALPVDGKVRPAGEGTWELALAGRTVEYRRDRDELLRTERSGDKVERREAYRLPDPATVNMEQQGRIAVLEIRRDQTTDRWRIQAAVGLDHRFERSEKKQ